MAISKIIFDSVTQMDLTSDTVSVNNLISPNTAHGADGELVIGTAYGGGITPSATHHIIHLEFSDSTDTDIDVYYNDSLIGTMITAYEPATYGAKTVTLAQLDNTTWYNSLDIPIGVELIDYTNALRDIAIDSQGEEYPLEWYYASDYTPVAPNMTFSYTGGLWVYIGVYDASKNFLRSIYIFNDATPNPNDSNTGSGTLSGNELTDAAFIRISGTGTNSSYMSLVRLT